MLPARSPLGAVRARHAGTAFVVACGAALLASCSSTGQSNRGVTTVDELPMERFLSQGYCPPVQIRVGTESVVVHERGHEDDPAFIRYQGSIGQTARECRVLGPDTLAIKVGIAGRVTAGPRGGTGSVTLPLRVAVTKQHGGTVFHSSVVSVTATISGPPYSTDYTQVIENITLKLGPEDRDLIVFVGFDEGAPKPTG